MYQAEDDPYCYPGTAVLKNRLGLTKQAELDAFEAEITTQRANEPLPAGTLSYTHYRAIHRHLFQDVYSWAGKVRECRIPTAMADSGKLKRLLAAATLAASLPGCTTSGGSSDDQMGRFLVAPDKFVLYNCAQLAETARTTAVREAELQQLMAKAGPDSAGRLVSALAYRPEYLTLRGDMNELRKAAAAKNCKFVPGAENPGGQASDNAVR